MRPGSCAVWSLHWINVAVAGMPTIRCCCSVVYLSCCHLFFFCLVLSAVALGVCRLWVQLGRCLGLAAPTYGGHVLCMYSERPEPWQRGCCLSATAIKAIESEQRAAGLVKWQEHGRSTM